MIFQILPQLFAWLAVAAGILAAAIWYKASKAEVHKSDLSDEEQKKGGYYVRGDVELSRTLKRQGDLNKWASIWTAAAILLQAIGMGLQGFGLQ